MHLTMKNDFFFFAFNMELLRTKILGLQFLSEQMTSLVELLSSKNTHAGQLVATYD